jgi:hypothetical protein
MRKITARLAGLAAIALTFAGALAATAAPVAALPDHSGAELSSCSGPVVRPSVYNPVCNDGAGSVLGLHWSSWGATASGHGELFTHRCVPDCALGTITLYPVDVSAWRVRDDHYTRFEYRFTHRVPAGYSREWVLSFYSGRWHGRIL